ncbi:hypothetical protein [Pseudonocardia humida]|uniref:Uncharacterized protein n=1 Tax=Pseudonocardia humida TaxID=2800819 RepID=A0ABT1A312_9PSEU|nr:hypothetical protein [Pseudonocardia humida]MCO1657406.1 hypothetical protein [Pseudonocardia humida]
MTDDELVVEYVLAWRAHSGLDREEIARMVVRRLGPSAVLDLASANLAVKGRLRASAYDAAVEYVLRLVLTLREDPDAG